MRAKHLLFIILQGIHALPPVFFSNFIKFQNHKWAMCSHTRWDRGQHNTEEHYFSWRTKCELHKSLAMGRFHLMENLALMIPFHHWLSGSAFKSLQNQLFPCTRGSQPVSETLLWPCFTHWRLMCCQLTDVYIKHTSHIVVLFSSNWLFFCCYNFYCCTQYNLTWRSWCSSGVSPNTNTQICSLSVRWNNFSVPSKRRISAISSVLIPFK